MEIDAAAPELRRGKAGGRAQTANEFLSTLLPPRSRVRGDAQ